MPNRVRFFRGENNPILMERFGLKPDFFRARMASIAPITPTMPSYFSRVGNRVNMRTRGDGWQFFVRACQRAKYFNRIITQNQTGFVAECF